MEDENEKIKTDNNNDRITKKKTVHVLNRNSIIAKVAARDFANIIYPPPFFYSKNKKKINRATKNYTCKRAP